MTVPEGPIKRITDPSRLVVKTGRETTVADEVHIHGVDGSLVARVTPAGIETRAEIVLITHSRNARHKEAPA